MISENVTKALNTQIVNEFYSGWLYMQMAAWFEKENLKGFSHWLRIQAQEESCHGLIFLNHLADRGGAVSLGAIPAPVKNFESALDIFVKGLEHENTVTAAIANLMDTAIAAKDFAAQSMLKWFIDEQVEEEANFDAIRSKLQRIGSEGNGLLQLDRELAARAFVLPPQLAASFGAAAAP